MSKQVGQPPYQGMISGGVLSNGLKDMEAAGCSNAFDIRLPDLHNNHHHLHYNINNNYDVFADNFGSKLLGRDLIQGIMGDESVGHYDDPTTTATNSNTIIANNNNNNLTMAPSKNLEKIWNSSDESNNNNHHHHPLGASSNHSSSSDFSSAFQPFSNNEGLGFLRRSSSITDELPSNNNNNNIVGSNNVFAASNNTAVGSSSSSSSIVGNNNNNNAIIGSSNKADNNNNNSDNLSSKLSSGVESPVTMATDNNNAAATSANNNDNINNNPNNSLGFLETTQIMQERINSNEGWGKKPIRQDTPWVLEGSMYAGRRDDLDPLPSQPTPQPDMQGPFWDQNTRISNCSESDRNFGVWTEPGRSNTIGMAGTSGVGIWKTNLNMGGKPDLQAPTPQQPQLPPHLFQQQQHQQQQQWNPADPRLLLAAVAQRLSEDDSKAKWSSSSSSSNITPWEDKNIFNSLASAAANNAPNHPAVNNPWNSSQRVDGMQPDINPNILQLLSLGVPLENAQKFAQSNDMQGKGKQFGGGSFDGTRGRPLFAQKLHNAAPSPLPHSFNPPPARIDFNPSSLLHSNIFSPGNNPPSMPPFNGLNPQENALKAQQLLMALQQQQQQQQQQQLQQNNNNPDLSAMMMMMLNEAKAGGDASKETILSQLMSNMRMDNNNINRWMPGNNNNNINNNNNDNNNWNLPHQDENAFFSNHNNLNNHQGGGAGMGGHLFNNNNNNRLPSWQANKLPHPNTANIQYNWLFIKNFSGDAPSLQFIGSQNRALKYFGGLQSNSVLVFFSTTEDAMKAKAQFAIAGMQFELLDNATANRELQSGMWNALPSALHPHHHQQQPPFLPRPPLAPGSMWPPVRF